jgi:hypothetical protein
MTSSIYRNVTLKDRATFHLYVATFQQHLHVEYISLSCYDIPELVVPIRITLMRAANKKATKPLVLPS